MLHRHCCILLTLLAAGADPIGPVPGRCSLPPEEHFPSLRRDLSHESDNTPLPARRVLFGIGIGFERTSRSEGVPVSQVLAGSPADRAGLAVGTIISEINDVSTVGRTDEECVRMIHEAGKTVKIKYLDPTTLAPRTVTIFKEMITIPN